MGVSFAEALRKDISRLRFAEEETKKKKPKKPKKRERTPATEATLKTRSVKLLIRNAATGLSQISMTYRKDTTGEIKSYRVAPYSYRSRKSKKGPKKMMLFAYDMDEKHIKGFVVRNVLKVQILEKKFKPRWPVEIAMIIIGLGLSILA
jgi:predicted DNA-binding transcriptional regulator YafY